MGVGGRYNEKDPVYLLKKRFPSNHKSFSISLTRVKTYSKNRDCN